MIVDQSRWKPFGQGRIAPQGSIENTVLAARLAAYKRNVASSYRSVSPDNILQTIPPGSHILSPKIDGECWFLYAWDGEVHLLSPSGRAITGIPITQEVAESLGDQRMLVAGELYTTSKSGRSHVYDIMSALKTGEHAKTDRLRFAAFDLIQDNDKDAQAWPFPQRVERLQEIFDTGDKIHTADFKTADSPHAVDYAFEQTVTQGGAEGIVLRLENGGILKIKPEITIDAAVVGYAESQGRVHELLLALVLNDNRFRLIGRVSIGMSAVEKMDLHERFSEMSCQSSFRKATDQGVLYRWIRPKIVVEVKCNDIIKSDSKDRPVRRMLLDYSEDGWSPIGPTNSISMINAVFLRMRHDKSVSVAEAGMRQVTDHVHLEETKQPQLDPAEALRREVYTKEGKSGTTVRKVVTWKTNKHGADDLYPPYVAFFTDYSAARKEPLKTSLRIASTLEKIDKIADQWLAENIKRGWNCVSRDLIDQSNIIHQEVGQTHSEAPTKPLSLPKAVEKTVTISFARSASPSFPIARKRLKSLSDSGALMIETDDKDREVWYSLTIGSGNLVELARRISNLTRMVRGWKSAEFCISREPVKPIDFGAFINRLEEVDRCRRKKIREASESCANNCRLGCDQLFIKPVKQSLDSYQSRQLWWTVGNFDGRMLKIDKRKLKRQASASRNELYRLCPNYDSKAVAQNIDCLPEVITAEAEGWKIIYRREDGSPAWLWPVKHPLPFGFSDARRVGVADAKGAMEHGQPHAAPLRNISTVSYLDVRGQDEAVEAVRDMVELPITHADLFAQVGVSGAGGGIILAGPPGTGKTLLARAVAGESKAHIEIVAGPELLSKWFGESERRLRAVFKRARELQPSIILFDELDGIAGTRNGDSSQRTFVAQLLTLLDGIESRGQVFVIATTNRPNDIDPALRRPGRFDRVVNMDLPNKSGRKSLFEHHTRNMKISQDIDFTQLATITPSLSGAQIAFICRRAGVLCIKEAIIEGPFKQSMSVKSKHLIKAIEEMRPTSSQSHVSDWMPTESAL